MRSDWRPLFPSSVTRLPLSVQIRAERLQGSWMEVGICCVKPVGGASFVMKCWALGRKRAGVCRIPRCHGDFCACLSGCCCVWQGGGGGPCLKPVQEFVQKGTDCGAARARRYLDPVHGIQGSQQDRCLGLLPRSIDIELEQLCNRTRNSPKLAFFFLEDCQAPDILDLSEQLISLPSLH